MNISIKDASAALDSIHAAGATVMQRRLYSQTAPFLILWGLVWAACNGISQFWPLTSGHAWALGSAIGLLATIWLSVKIAKSAPEVGAEGRAIGRRYMLLGTTIICFFIAMFIVLAPLTGRRMGVFISLFWTLAYMAGGAWVGMRLFAIGLIGSIGIVLSYLYADHYFSLAMAIVGGGTLIAGGLWLRKL
jgi:hypothetical protein